MPSLRLLSFSLVDLLLGSDARSAKVFEDVIWTLLVLNLVVLAFAAATVTAALRRMSLAPEKMLLLAPCVLVMSLFVLWHSTHLPLACHCASDLLSDSAQAGRLYPSHPRRL